MTRFLTSVLAVTVMAVATVAHAQCCGAAPAVAAPVTTNLLRTVGCAQHHGIRSNRFADAKHSDVVLSDDHCLLRTDHRCRTRGHNRVLTRRHPSPLITLRRR